MVTDDVGSRIDTSRLFQTRGPLMAKDRSPNVVLVDGTSSFIISDNDLRPCRRWQSSGSHQTNRLQHGHWDTCGL